MDNSISISLGTPDYGWLPVNLRYKDLQINFDASNVLNNPIDEINNIITQLKDNETKRIIFWLEAPAYFFDITKKGKSYILAISYSEDLLDKITEPNLLHTINGSESEIIEPLRAAIRRFETLTYDKQHWLGFNDDDEPNKE